jgi:N-acetylmuramoyl-L-alanine amidase
VLAPLPQAQGTAPATPLTLVTRDGRRPVPTIILNGQEFIGLDDVASMFQVAVREDALAGGVTVTYKGRTVVASADQPMASVSGRVVTLPAPVARVGRRLFVPIDFIPRALAPIYDAAIELRRAPRMLVVGNVRVARVVPRIEAVGPPTRATIEITSCRARERDNRRWTGAVARRRGRARDRVHPPGHRTDRSDPHRRSKHHGCDRIEPSRRHASRLDDDHDRQHRVLVEVPLAPQFQDASAAPAPPVPGPPLGPAAPTADAIPLLPPPGPRLQTMVIDPGHGGDDVGVRGPKGTVEKQITLDVARRLKTLVETRSAFAWS